MRYAINMKTKRIHKPHCSMASGLPVENDPDLTGLVWCNACCAAEKAEVEHRYIGNRNTGKYHDPECPYSKCHPNDRQWFDSREKAEKLGFKGCGICIV